MDTKTIPAMALLLAATLSSPAAAADASARQKAAVCTACHGADGKKPLPNTPKIGGATAAHLEQSLRDFRSGKRSNVQMQPMAKGLSDADIKLLAQYFSSLK